jgi:glycosyltransferase involved in cell wall biosynthesis
MTPLVSIPILCHDYGHFLPEAIESALAQTYPNVEIAVWDDGSTDGSAEVAARYAPGVEVVAQANRGVIRTCNAAAERARGEYLVFLSADDRLVPTYVEELLDGLTADASFAYSDVQLFGAQSGIQRALPFSPAVLTLVGNFVNGSALLRRRDFLAVGGYDGELEQGAYEDWDLWLRMVESGRRGRYVPRPLLLWRRHEAGSRNPTRGPEVDRAREVIRSRHAALFARYADSREPAVVTRLAGVRSRILRRAVEDASWRRFQRPSSSRRSERVTALDP